MKLSILIPLYNKEKYIERCLNSLLDQDIAGDEYEIVVVDDGSKDNGADIVQRFADDHPNIKLIRQENQGPSVARNRCLKEAKGEYVYFLDADDYLATNVLRDLLELGMQNNLEILEFNTKEIPENAPIDKVHQNPSPNQVEVDVLDGMAYMAKHGFWNEAWRYFVKSNLLRESNIKFIEGTLYEDAIFTASLFLCAKRMAKLNLDVHRYIVVENSIVTSKDPAHNLKFINGMVYAIEHFDTLSKGLDASNEHFTKVGNRIKGRQQAFVFALIIRWLKFQPFGFKELKKILKKLNVLGVYPMDPNIPGIGPVKGYWVYDKIMVPLFNNKTFLFLAMKVLKFLPR